MKKLVVTLLTIAAALNTVSASAQFARSEDAIRYRQSAFYLMHQHFGRVAAMASGKTPFDPKAAIDNAATLEVVGKLPWSAFGEGTDRGREHRALAEVWTDKAKFKEYADAMQVELTKLSAATKTGSLDSVKQAVRGVGGSCKTCHDAFHKN